jgi:protein ImuB
MMRIACLYLLESPSQRKPETIQALAEACFRFTPQVAMASQAIFLEISASHLLFSEQMLVLKLGSLAKRFGCLSRISFGDSAGEALALARNPGFFYGRDLPLEALADYAFPFAVDPHAVKKILELIQALKILGLKNVGEFAHLPPATLASRFGKEAVKLSACARNEYEAAWPGFHPSPRVIEKSPIENSENIEAILFVLKGLVDRTVARLCGRGERVSVLKIEFELVQWGLEKSKVLKREFNLALPLPQGSAHGLLPILQEYLSQCIQREPLAAPVDSVQVEVLETLPSRGSQRDFFTKKEEESEVWEGLVARLSQKLGKDRVFTALPVKRYLPEKAYSKSLKRESRDAYAQYLMPTRPTRLLKYPELLRLKKEDIAEASGPERLSGEWWSSQYDGFNRDYYRLKTVTGEELWVFMNRNSPEKLFYVHGYFD